MIYVVNTTIITVALGYTIYPCPGASDYISQVSRQYEQARLSDLNWIIVNSINSANQAQWLRCLCKVASEWRQDKTG